MFFKATKMKKTLFILSIFITGLAQGQITIFGKVTDNKNHPLYGISITLKDTYDGATTDSSGKFSFTTSEKGNHGLIASSMEYHDMEKSIVIENKNLEVDFLLKEKITQLNAVVISVGTFAAGDQKKGTVLNSLDVVTTASANGDITSAFKTVPGTQQVGESEGLFVRGGTATETKYFIDGSLVNNFFYSSEPGKSTRGRFNPFLFKGTTFSSGGYSALYGQALSSVLLMESIDLPDKTSADFGVSYLGANAGIQKLSKNKQYSWGVTYAYTNLALVYGLIKQKFDYFKVPEIHQGDFNFRIKTPRNGMVKYYGQISHTRVGFRNQDIDSLSMKDAFALTNFNFYQNLSWRQKLGDGWMFNLGLSYSNNRDQISMELQDDQNQQKIIPSDSLLANKNFDLDARGHFLNSKLVFEKRIGGINVIRFGSEYNSSKENSDFTRYDNNKYNRIINENLFSAFAEADIYLSKDFALKIGGRTEHSELMKKWNIAPRISLAYQFANKGQLSAAYGIFYQNPESKYLPSGNMLHFQKATHYILQYQKMGQGQTFRAEVFYKKYDDLIKTSPSSQSFAAINNNGYGDAKGIEFFWRDKKSIENVDYWISYSYLDTKRDFLNYPGLIKPPFASTHTASLVVKKFVMPLKTQFNLSYTYASGRPYYDIHFDNTSKSFNIKEQGETKSYNDLSFSINYVPSLGKKDAKSFTVFVFQVTNILGFNNIYTYQYSNNGKNKVAVTAPSKSFLFIGCFISLGIDRTEDAINNHL